MNKIDGQMVYFGLSRLTDDRTVIREAYQYWQSQLSDQPFDVLDVASKLTDYIGSDSNGKKTLMIALHAANNKSESELDNVPNFISGNDADLGADTPVSQSNNTADAGLPAHSVMTVELFKLMYSRLRQVDSSGYAELSNIIADEGLDNTPQSLHGAIIVSPDRGLKLGSDVTEQQCQALTHALCMLIMEVVGPMVTDDLIDNVIASLLENSHASQYDPRNLL